MSLRRPAIVLLRAVFVLVLCSPVAAVMWHAPYGLDDLRSWSTTAGYHASEFVKGRTSEESVLGVCIFVIAATWARVVWVVVVVLVCRSRGREVRSRDRFVVRCVLRLLVMTPLVLDVSASRVHALAPVVGIDEESPSVSAGTMSRDAVLISIIAAVGVSWRLRQRRLTGLREGRVPTLDTTAFRFESESTRHGSDRALTRLECAARTLVSSGHGDFTLLVQHSSGLMHVECHERQVDPSPWTRISETILVLEDSVSTEEMQRRRAHDDSRIPVLIPIGTSDAGSIWINLESVGSFFVEGRDAESDEVWDGLCQSLSLSPLHLAVNLIGHVDQELFGRRQMLAVDDSRAHNIARILHDRDSPSVVLIESETRREMRIAESEQSFPPCHGLIRRGRSWFLVPMRRLVEPTKCCESDRLAIGELLGGPVRPLPCAHMTEEPDDSGQARHEVLSLMLSEVSFIVRVMGRPSVDHVEHGEVAFERSRSEELVVWLALHPQRRRRTAARAEMWNVPIKDSTFSNITSDVRRSLTAFEEPPLGEQWLSVTLNEDLPLHRRITTDVALLEKCLDHARRFPDDGGIEVLMFGLELVRSCPLEGSQYVWRDATGLTTDIAMLVVRSAMLCCELALENGDIESLYRASAKGLAAVPGHEGLVAARLRQHAARGDRALLVSEWESYCRSLNEDDWGDARPSSNMIELWFSLSGRTS